MIGRRALLAGLAANVAIQHAAAQAGAWANVVGGDVGYGAPVNGLIQGDALLLRREPDGHQTLHRWPWSERIREAGNGETPSPLIAVSATATDPLVPVRDGPFLQDAVRWKLWREGPTVHAIDSALRHQTLLLDEPAPLVGPALQRSGGDVVVFALAAQRRRLWQLTFPRAGDGVARVARSIELPLTVGAACAALAAPGRFAVGVWAQTPAGLELGIENGESLLRASAAGGLRALSRPVLMLGARGLCLAVAAQGDDGVALVRFTAGHRAVEVIPMPMPATSAPPLAAALVFDRSGQPIVFALMADGRGMRLTPGSAAAPVHLVAPPLQPLVFAPGTRGGWLLCCDPLNGPVMAQVAP